MPTRPQFETEEQSDAQIRVAIGKANGRHGGRFAYCPECKVNIDRHSKDDYDQISGNGSHYPRGCGGKLDFDLPDYLGDLRAAQSAYLSLGASERDDFTKHLYEVLGGKGLLRQSDLLAATPRQWSLAYCRTKGLLP